MFSVIMAAYKRGLHIRPSIESVLRQSYEAFELLVVSDGPDEATEAAVAGFRDSRVAYCSLYKSFGSQSYPNNCGIAETSEPWVAYLGHDDIWSGQHLAVVADTIARDPAADVVVSGCISHGPPDSWAYWITGLFTGDGHVNNVLPPSSFAHRRSAVTRVGGWRDPRTTKAPTDQDLLGRMTESGARFVSTGTTTVHKFSAAHRYLCYLDPTSDEQDAMLRHPRLDRPDEWVAEIEAAKADGTFGVLHDTRTDGAAGEAFARSLQARGLSRQPPEPLTGKVRLAQSDEARGLDWQNLEAGPMPFRWSGPNPRPKIRLPFRHDGSALVTLSVVEYKGPVTEVTISCGGVALPTRIKDVGARAHIEFVVPMRASADNLVELHTPTMFRPFDQRTDGPRLGIAIGDMTIEPC